MKKILKKQFNLFVKYKDKDMTFGKLIIDNKITYLILTLIFGCLYTLYLFVMPTMANLLIVVYLSFIIRDIGYFRRSAAFWPTLRSVINYDKINFLLSEDNKPENSSTNQLTEITEINRINCKETDKSLSFKNTIQSIFKFLGILGVIWICFTLIVMFKKIYFDVKINKSGIIQEIHESKFNKIKDVYATVIFDDGNSCIFKLYKPGYKIGDEINVNIKQTNDYIFACEGN